MINLLKSAFIIGLFSICSCSHQSKETNIMTNPFPPEDFFVFQSELVDGRPVVGNINNAYRDYLEKAAYPWCLTLNIALDEEHLYENGLPKGEESTIANGLEHELFAEIEKRAVAHYIGHMYNNTFLDVFIYLDDPNKVHEYLQTQINKEGLIRPFRYEIKEEKEWVTVKDFFKSK